MDIVKARTFCVSSRPWVLVILVCTLLLASTIWNVRQHKLLQNYRSRAVAEEQKQALVAEAEVQHAQATREKKAAQSAADARVQQLYREIDNLSRINEQILTQPLRQQRAPKMADGVGEGGGAP
jgi:hypothetical protein